MRVYDCYAHIRRRSRATSPRRAASPATAGSSSLPAAPGLPHPDLRRRDGPGARGGRRGRRTDVYLAREDADPAVTGALVADAVPLPPTGSPSSPSSPTSRGARGASPAGRPGADPRRRRRHRARPARPGPAGEGTACLAAPASVPARRRRPAQPPRLRPPAVGPPLARLEVRRRGAPPGRPRGRRGLAGLLLLGARRQAGRGRRRRAARRSRRARRGWRPRGRAAGPGRPARAREADRGAGRGPRRRGDPPWPDTVRIVVEERVAVAVVEIGGTLRGLDAEGVVFRPLPPAARRAAPRGDLARRRLATRCARPPPWWRRCRPTSRARSTTSRWPRSTRSRWCCATAGPCVWGSAEESDPKAEVLAALLARPGQTYDVSVPGQPTVRP